MKMVQRLKEAADKFFFCYTSTDNILSFFKLIYFTKLYRLRKKLVKYEKLHDKFFSISLKSFPGKRIFLRIYAGDIDIFYEVFYRKIYEIPESEEKCVIVDAGANVGFASLYFLKQRPLSIVFCIEPDPDNLIFLQKNLQAEIGSDKVILVKAALSVKDGFVNLKQSHFKYNSSITEEHVENANAIIAYSMPTFFKKFKIETARLLKMDIEGAEENIFKEDVSWLSCVTEVLIEFHSLQIKELCVDNMINHGFNFQPANSRESTDVFHFTKSY